MSCQKETPQTPRRRNLRILRFRASPKAQSLRCSSFPPHKHACAADREQPAYPSNKQPGKRSGAKRRRAKKTAPQSRKDYGIPTYIRRTVKIKLIPGKPSHPKRLSFRGLGGFLWPRPKKASQEGFRNPPGCSTRGRGRPRTPFVDAGIFVPKIYIKHPDLLHTWRFAR